MKQGHKTGYVFPASAGNGFFIGTPRIFARIRATKNKDGEYIIKQGLTIHGLRHTFASLGADMGYSDFTIAGLLGHSLGTVTSRYTHAVDTSLIRACDNISIRIENALAGKIEQKGQVIDIGRVA
jgi:integrase